MFIHVAAGAAAAAAPAAAPATEATHVAAAAPAAAVPSSGGGTPFKVYMHYEPAADNARDTRAAAAGGDDAAMTHLFRWDSSVGDKGLSELLHEFCGL